MEQMNIPVMMTFADATDLAQPILDNIARAGYVLPQPYCPNFQP